VSGGDFHIDDGEIVYRGPNVMLGYAGLRAELALGDELGGVLRTGDLGSLDADGFLTVRGRVKRIAKIAGRRVSLDEFEQALGGGVAAVAAPPGIDVYRTGQPAGDLARVCADLGLPTPCVRLRTVSELPRTGSGKVDYPELTQLATRGGA
jgi:acyl-coenzyme A synthetase/AMP-(fatty) acid ligase